MKNNVWEVVLRPKEKSMVGLLGRGHLGQILVIFVKFNVKSLHFEEWSASSAGQ